MYFEFETPDEAKSALSQIGGLRSSYSTFAAVWDWRPNHCERCIEIDFFPNVSDLSHVATKLGAIRVTKDHQVWWNAGAQKAPAVLFN
jgi:hypothetical protein